MWKSYVEIFTYEKTQSPGPHIYTTSYSLLYVHFKETNLMRFHVPCFPFNGMQNKPIYIWMLAIHMWNHDSCVDKKPVTGKKKFPVQLYIFFHVFLSRANMCKNVKITWEIDFRVALKCHAPHAEIWSTGEKQFTSHLKLTLWKWHHLKYAFYMSHYFLFTC